MAPDMIRQAPTRYFGLLAYCVDGVYRVTDYDYHPEVQELLGVPMTVEDGILKEKEDECLYSLDAEEVICFITPDSEQEFVKRYIANDEHIQEWLDGEEDMYDTLEQFGMLHSQHIVIDNADGTWTFMPANQMDETFILQKASCGKWELVDVLQPSCSL